MSAYIEYNPALFLLERAETVSSTLGEFILGESKLGNADTGAWVPVQHATFGYSVDYSADDNNTLIFESETASVSMSYWDTVADPLYPADRIRATYAGEVIFLGTVANTNIVYSVDPDAADHGATRRVDLTASAVGTYAAALERIVCWKNLPKEPAITRIRRWVDVANW